MDQVRPMRSRAMSAIVAFSVSAAVFLGAAGAAFGQPFPSKPIHFVVPIGTGGAPDVLARVLGQRITESTGQPVIVDNRPGGGGIIAVESVMRAVPDGYTLLVADSSNYAIAPSLYAQLPYDPVRDFVPVTLAAAPPIFMVANAATPIRSVQDLIALAKSAAISYGSSGNGNGNHLAMELFRSMTGTNLVHIPYKGVATLVPALLSGDVSVGFTGLPSVQPHARAGKLRILAVASGKRSGLAPDVPTVAESGVPKFEVNISIGFLAPAGTPRDAVTRLNEELVRALKLPEVRQRLELVGIEPVGSTPEQFGQLIRSEMQDFRALVKTTGIRID
jgi:tripartite-type tricarboxylate transporter receptor subunit TctC